MRCQYLLVFFTLLLLSSTANSETGQHNEADLNELDYESCRKSKIGIIEERSRKTNIHKWVDKHGQTHFGAEPPTSTESQKIVKRTNHTDYFELNFGQQSKLPRYEIELTNNIENVYRVLVSIVGQEHLKQTRVNLSIFDDEDEYQSFYTQHTKRSGFKGRGFHIGSKNIVGIKEENERQAMATSIHEATHVITRGNFGRLPKWLNEGIAEYMETLESQFQTIYIKPETSWNGHIKPPHISITEVMSSTKESWDGENVTKTFAYSWALVSFLLSSNESKKIVSKYLTLLATLPCDAKLNSLEFFGRNYDSGISQMQKDFEVWLDTNSFNTHYY